MVNVKDFKPGQTAWILNIKNGTVSRMETKIRKVGRHTVTTVDGTEFYKSVYGTPYGLDRVGHLSGMTTLYSTEKASTEAAKLNVLRKWLTRMLANNFWDFTVHDLESACLALGCGLPDDYTV